MFARNKILNIFKKKETNQLNKIELEFLPEALEIIETPPSPLGRIMAWFCIVVFLIALLWSYFGHIDEVAIAQGKVIPSGYTKTIQVFDTGVVKNIMVKNASQVNQGDVLIELDTTMTEADLVRQEKERAYYKLELQRLSAEQAEISFNIANPEIFTSEDIQFQRQLYASRVAEYKTKVAVLQKAIEQAESEINIAQSIKDKLEAQYTLAMERENSMQKLIEQEAVSRFQFLEYFERRTILEKDIASQGNSIAKARQNLLQCQESLQNAIDVYKKDIMTQIINDRRELQIVEEELKKAKEKRRLSTIVSPINGTVQELSIHTVGGVVTPAQVLMLVVPQNASMEIEAWIENKDIGFIYENQEAEIKVETFNFQKYGTLDASVVEVSSDAAEDKERGLIYRVLLRTKTDYFDLANGRTVYLTPGMAVTAEIKTRQKRIIEYFMDPFIKYKSEGLRER